MNVACPVCGVTAEVSLGASREVSVGTVAASVERRPVVTCPSGHDASPPEFAGHAMEAVATAVPRARSRLMRADGCDACREPLAMPVRRTTRTVSVQAPGIPVVTIHLDLPLTRCGVCGVEQVPSRSQEDLTVVVPALFAPAPVS